MRQDKVKTKDILPQFIEAIELFNESVKQDPREEILRFTALMNLQKFWRDYSLVANFAFNDDGTIKLVRIDSKVNESDKVEYEF